VNTVKKGKSLIFFISSLTILLFAAAVYGTPNGVSITTGPTTTAATTTPANVTAQGGNITEVNISVTVQTIAWQGFYGEVTGALTLDDSAGNTLINFSFVAANGGEVYASRDNAVAFASIAAQNTCTIDELLTGTGSDRVNSTFTNNTNPSFLVGDVNITANTACATNTFNSTGQATFFDEIILTDDGGTTSIYATIMENNRVGFDGNTHDYQLIVPDNRTTANTVYFFYAELS